MIIKSVTSKLMCLYFFYYTFYFLIFLSMKNSIKRIVSKASLLALVLTNSAFADLSLTGGTTSLSLTWATEWTSYSGSILTWSLDVTVNAQVLPTLSFSISTWSLNLGTLDASKISTGAVDLTLSTNAANGAIVSVTSDKVDGLTSSQGDVIDYTGSAIAAWTEWYNLTVNGATASKWVTPTITNATISTQTAEVMAVNNPTDTAKVTVQSNASIDSITPAGNYSIVHTFTVTWTF